MINLIIMILFSFEVYVNTSSTLEREGLSSHLTAEHAYKRALAIKYSFWLGSSCIDLK